MDESAFEQLESEIAAAFDRRDFAQVMSAIEEYPGKGELSKQQKCFLYFDLGIAHRTIACLHASHNDPLAERKSLILAANAFGRALELDPGWLKCRTDIALIKLELGEDPAAIIDLLNDAVFEDGSERMVMYEVHEMMMIQGTCHCLDGQFDKASTLYKDAITLCQAALLKEADFSSLSHLQEKDISIPSGLRQFLAESCNLFEWTTTKNPLSLVMGLREIPKDPSPH